MEEWIYAPKCDQEERKKIVEEVEVTMERYFRTSKEFYDAALSYLEARNKHSENLSKLIGPIFFFFDMVEF
jgi:hypothetical protein